MWVRCQDLLKKLKQEHKTARETLERRIDEEDDGVEETSSAGDDEEDSDEDEGKGGSMTKKLERMIAKQKTETE